MQEYSQTYAELGHLLVKAKIAESIPNRCAELLPHNFRAVDLGSNGTKFADRLMDLCHRSGKVGTCLSVDPFPTSPEVIKMTSEEFIETQDDSSLDLALCQYSVHFNKDQPSFFRKMYQKLKPNGNFIICQVGNDVKLPWTDPIFQNFKKEYIKAADIIPRNIFQWTIQNERFEVKMAKSQFRKLIQKRGWSNLLSNTKQEIEQCLNNIDSIKEDILTCESSVWVYNLTKLKHELHS